MQIEDRSFCIETCSKLKYYLEVKNMTKKLNIILKKTIAVLVVVILLLLCILLFFRTYIDKLIKTQENYFMENNIHQKFSEIHKQGMAPAILLIHGFGGSPFDLKPLTDALEKHGYAFNAIVLPGHGTTPKDLENITKSEWLKKAFTAYEKLKKEYGEVSIVGFSMGGAIGLSIAAEKKVSKLVLISPYFKVKEQWFYFGKPEVWAKRLNKIIPFVKKPKIGQINDPEGLKRYIAYRNLPTKSVSELSILGKFAAAKSKNVTCETLWIHSKKDIVADFEFSKKMFSTIASKKKYFLEYNKSNHVILYDYDHVDAINQIMSFLKGNFDERSKKNN